VAQYIFVTPRRDAVHCITARAMSLSVVANIRRQPPARHALQPQALLPTPPPATSPPPPLILATPSVAVFAVGLTEMIPRYCAIRHVPPPETTHERRDISLSSKRGRAQGL